MRRESFEYRSEQHQLIKIKQVKTIVRLLFPVEMTSCLINLTILNIRTDLQHKLSTYRTKPTRIYIYKLILQTRTNLDISRAAIFIKIIFPVLIALSRLVENWIEKGDNGYDCFNSFKKKKNFTISQVNFKMMTYLFSSILALIFNESDYIKNYPHFTLQITQIISK